MIFYRNLREITFRLTNVIPERIIFVSRGITVHAFCSLIADNKTRFSCHMKHILYVQTGTPCLLWRVCLKWNSYKMFLLLVHVLWISTLLLCSYARTCFRNSDYELTGSCFLWTYRLLLPYERSVKNDETKDRRRSKSVKNESDKVSPTSERTERHVKSPSCTVTSAPDSKVWSPDYSARLPEGRRLESGPLRVGSGSLWKSICCPPPQPKQEQTSWKSLRWIRKTDCRLHLLEFGQKVLISMIDK